MSRFVAWWGQLPAVWKDLSILGAAVMLGFGAGTFYHNARQIPDSLRGSIYVLSGRVDTLEYRFNDHLTVLHAQLMAADDSSRAERRELLRLMREAAATRCWLVTKVAPQSIPPAECRQ